MSLPRVLAIASASVLAAALLGCSPRRLAYFPPPPPETPEGEDASLAAGLDRMRAQVGMNPRGVWEATTYAQLLATALERGTAQRRGWKGDMLVAEALSALAAAEAESPAERAELLTAKGRLLVAAGRVEEGVAALRASMDEKPSTGACDALIGALDAQGDPGKEIVPICKKARAAATDDLHRYGVLRACFERSHAKTPEEGLAWASEDDIDLYKEYSAHLAQQLARLEQDRERLRKEPLPEDGWSVSLRNDCSSTVVLFIGGHPLRFGHHTSLAPGATQTYFGLSHHRVWIVDGEQRGVSSLSPKGEQRASITPGCAGFAVRLSARDEALAADQGPGSGWGSPGWTIPLLVIHLQLSRSVVVVALPSAAS